MQAYTQILKSLQSMTLNRIVVCGVLTFVCGLQAYVSRARVESFSLIADMMYVSSNAPRIARSVFEICLRRGWSSCADLALTLCKVTIPAPPHCSGQAECIIHSLQQSSSCSITLHCLALIPCQVTIPRFLWPSICAAHQLWHVLWQHTCNKYLTTPPDSRW